MLPGPPIAFRDPVHGYIDVLPHEREIIDTRAFQRLRRISQLGLSSYVYHGAEHSRFGHSLGVMHLAGRFSERLVTGHADLLKERLSWSSEEFEKLAERQILMGRLAGMLHDVGHAPFSHVADYSLFAPGKKHEDYSAAIITETEIGDIIDDRLARWEVTRSEVAGMIQHGSYGVGFVTELISSPWDVDKMDYLLRDSHYCGVKYGLYDVGRLMDSMTLYDDPASGLKLGIDRGGIHAIEGFVLARYFMFTQVYFHEVRRAYDFLLVELIKEILEEKLGQSHFPEGVDDYLNWDDNVILGEAVRMSKESVSPFASRIIERKHPKAVYDTGSHPDTIEAQKALLQLPRRLGQQFPDETVWVDQASDHPERFRKEHLPVRLQEGSWRSLTSESKVLDGLEEIGGVRVYADVRGDEDLAREIRKASREFMVGLQ